MFSAKPLHRVNAVQQFWTAEEINKIQSFPRRQKHQARSNPFKSTKNTSQYNC
jgi:hypothetical protein